MSKNRVSGVYGGIIALGYNTELVAKKNLPVPKCWKDLAIPVYKNEVMLGNPNSSGTAYLMLATLVQVFGEDEAFKLPRRRAHERQPVCALGHRPDDRGDARRNRDRQHRAAWRDQRDRARLSRAPVLPCEGVGYEIGSIGDHQGHAQSSTRRSSSSIGRCRSKGRRSGSTSRNTRYPTNRSVTLPPQVPKLTDIKVIDYDFAKYGSSETRKRLLDRWEKRDQRVPPLG